MIIESKDKFRLRTQNQISLKLLMCVSLYIKNLINIKLILYVVIIIMGKVN